MGILKRWLKGWSSRREELVIIITGTLIRTIIWVCKW